MLYDLQINYSLYAALYPHVSGLKVCKLFICVGWFSVLADARVDIFY